MDQEICILDGEETLLLQNEAGDQESINEEDFLPRSVRRVALIIISLCWFFSYMSFVAITLWIPLLSSSTKTSRSPNLTNTMYVIALMMGFPAGVIMDALIKKTHILTIGVIVAGSGIFTMAIITMIDATYTMKYPNLYLTIFILIGVTASFINVALPTLGGDQIPKRSVVRLFYAAFYFWQKLGDVLAMGMYLYISRTNEQQDMLDIGWPVILFTFIFLSIISTLIVVCSRLTRQIDADLSVITNPFRMVKQAFQRRKEHVEGDNFLSTAKQQNGGDFPNQLVDEIVNFSKLIAVLFCLLPTLFAIKLTDVQLTCYTGTSGNLFASYNGNTTTHGVTTLIFPLINSSTAMISIPIVYALCNCLKRVGYVPTLLHRLVAGWFVMVLEGSISLLFINLHIGTVACAAVPYALNGLGRALIYTAGYEMLLVTAPRSMQGSAIGIKYFIQGIGGLIYMEIADLSFGLTDLQSLNVKLIAGGVVCPSLGVLALGLLQRKFDLGINIP